MKLHKFSNTYQLVNTQANCGGIDSCYLTEHSHFDTPLSPVGKTDEMCFLSQRNDMRARLKYLAYSSQIPYTIAEEKLKNASDSCLLYDYLFQQCLQGSTHLSLFDTLLLEKHLQEYKHSEKEYDFPWPPFIISCHPKYNTCGYPVLCPTTIFQRKDFRLLWILSCIVLNNNFVWNLFTEYSISTEQDIWTGWLLKYLSSAVLNKRYKPKRRYNEEKTIYQIAHIIESSIEIDRTFSIELLPHATPIFRWRHLSNLLNDIPGIFCWNVNYGDEIDTQDFSLD
jgi:hypothetical protein